MDKQEVIERLCALVTLVGEDVYHNDYPHDCFCHLAHNTNPAYFKVYEDIIEFIENATKEAIRKDNQNV